MIQIRDNHSEELDQIIHCANIAFGDSIVKDGFSAVLPKLYGSRAKADGNHLLAVEEGQILGLVLAEPLHYQVCQTSLKVAAIGTVSVLPEARKRGIMKQLMDEALRRMREEEVDFAVLTGQRQRYAYWGFRHSGMDAQFTWNEANLRHCKEMIGKDMLELVPMDYESEWIHEAWELWERQNVRIVRERERFYDILCTWNARPYACRLNNKFVGYVVMNLPEGGGGVKIFELVLEDGISAVSVLGAIQFHFKRSNGWIAVAPYQQKMIQELEDICESEQLGSYNQFLILHYKKVLEAFLRLKNTYQPLNEGSAVLRILKPDGSAELLRIVVKAGEVSVEALEEKDALPTVELTAQKAGRILFTPSVLRHPELEAMPGNWFPLPLHMDELDCC